MGVCGMVGINQRNGCLRDGRVLLREMGVCGMVGCYWMKRVFVGWSGVTEWNGCLWDGRVLLREMGICGMVGCCSVKWVLVGWSGVAQWNECLWDGSGVTQWNGCLWDGRVLLSEMSISRMVSVKYGRASMNKLCVCGMTGVKDYLDFGVLPCNYAVDIKEWFKCTSTGNDGWKDRRSKIMRNGVWTVQLRMKRAEWCVNKDGDRVDTVMSR